MFFDMLTPTFKEALCMYLDEIGNSMVSARRERDVFLIVCGSASSWIVKNLLKNTEGLYGRITDRIQLKPFTLAECEKFAFPGWSLPPPLRSAWRRSATSRGE